MWFLHSNDTAESIQKCLNAVCMRMDELHAAAIAAAAANAPATTATAAAAAATTAAAPAAMPEAAQPAAAILTAAECRPAAAQPAASQPTATEQAGTQPVAAIPVAAKPVTAQPAPAGAQHESVKPAAAKPAAAAAIEDMWFPKQIIIDDSQAEQNAIDGSEWARRGTVWDLCIWHVKRAWTMNAIHKIPDKENRKLVMKALSAAMYAKVTLAAPCLCSKHMIVLISFHFFQDGFINLATPPPQSCPHSVVER